MKSPTKHDIILSAIIAVFAGVITFAITAMYFHNKTPITIENPVNTALIKRNDSLEAVVAQRDLIIASNDKFQFAHDSALIMNNKTLAKEYDKIKDLDDSTRSEYVERALKRANVRR